MDIQQGMPPQPQMEPSPLPPAETEDEETLVRREASQLLQFLQADPGARAHIDRTIRQHLQGGVDMETWGNILGGLTMYAGEAIAHLVLMALLNADDLLNPDGSGYVAMVEKYVGAEVWPYLRGLLAMYSADVKEAYAIAGENPHAWRVVNRRVFYEELSERWQTTFEIIKYNGERIYLEETPSSAILLCSAVLDALNFMPVEKAQQAVDPRAVEDLVGLFYTFIEHFAPDLLEEEQEGEAT